MGRPWILHEQCIPMFSKSIQCTGPSIRLEMNGSRNGRVRALNGLKGVFQHPLRTLTSHLAPDNTRWIQSRHGGARVSCTLGQPLPTPFDLAITNRLEPLVNPQLSRDFRHLPSLLTYPCGPRWSQDRSKGSHRGPTSPFPPNPAGPGARST